MKFGTPGNFAGIALTVMLMAYAGLAQTSSRSSSRPTLPTPNPNATLDTTTQPTYISGKVLLDGGTAPTEPVAIERICNGSVRREGYTDSNGHYQFQLGQNTGFHDASESNDSNSGLFPTDRPSSSRQTPEIRRIQLQGCELRALLPGFQSSTSPIRTDGSSWQIEIGTLFLRRMENVIGATISMTSMTAPKNARQAYEKAQKEFSESKYPEAEKELTKAVKLYPTFAAAWSLLGDIHVRQNQFDTAIDEYQQAVHADAQFVNPSFGLAIIAVQQKRWQDAAQLTSLVTRLNAYAFPNAFFYNAVANYYLEKLDAAEESGKRFKTLDNDHKHPDIALMLSDIRARKKDFMGAAQEIRDYLAIVPNPPNEEAIKSDLKRFEQLSLAGKQ